MSEETPSSPADVVHLTLDLGVTIACTPGVPRLSLFELPVIVELYHHEKITCPECISLASEELGRRANNARSEAVASESLARIAGALERIAVALEEPKDPSGPPAARGVNPDAL